MMIYYSSIVAVHINESDTTVAKFSHQRVHASLEWWWFLVNGLPRLLLGDGGCSKVRDELRYSYVTITCPSPTRRLAAISLRSEVRIHGCSLTIFVLFHRIAVSHSFSADLNLASTPLSCQKCPAPVTSTLEKRDVGSAFSCSAQSRIFFAEAKISWSP
jgi:hypothetical protein